MKDWWRSLCSHSYVAENLPHKQKHDKTWFRELLQITAEEFDFFIPSLELSLAAALLKRHQRIPDV